MQEKILVGVDFIGANFPSALYSLQRWTAYLALSKDFKPAIGISTSCERNKPLPGFRNFTAAEAFRAIKDSCKEIEVLCWDTQVSQLVLKELSNNKINSCPFWPEFSYGGVINRLLLLANVASCDYIVRIDPGTLPPLKKSFDDVINHHLLSMRKVGSVISRGYEGRLALRDTFLTDGKSDEQGDLVKDITGINPLAQVTGGAMFTSRVPGVPAPPFPAYEQPTGKKNPTLVWA